MLFSRRIRQKAKYSSPLRFLLDGLGRVGIHIVPYYLMAEGIADDPIEQYEQGFEEYQTSLFGEDDMAELAKTGGGMVLEEKNLERLRAGCLCLGLRHQGKIAAYTWCDMRDICFLDYRYPLHSHEVYLFNAETLIDYRGKGLAPYLRYQLYKELASRDKTTLYSITNCLNRSSFRFKEKLGAKRVELNLGIKVFKYLQLNFQIKHYQEGLRSMHNARGEQKKL